MFKFIALTDKKTATVVFVNVSFIMSVHSDSKKTMVTLALNTGSRFFTSCLYVKESPSEVMEKMKNCD